MYYFKDGVSFVEGLGVGVLVFASPIFSGMYSWSLFRIIMTDTIASSFSSTLATSKPSGILTLVTVKFQVF